jgi:hypothetical protein
MTMARDATVDKPLIAIHLQLTQSEFSSLLMGQITQARHSRLTLGEANPTTCIDLAVLEKLVSAQRKAAAEEPD